MTEAQQELGASFLSGGGEMGGLIRAYDWQASPLGPAADWPQSLKSIVNLIIASPLPMIMLWGPDLIQIYNDGYAVICGPKHPRALGQPIRDCWPDVWGFNAPIYAAVLAGEAQSFAGQPLVIERHGRPEEAWFDLTYSPVRDETGAVAGVLVTVVETTGEVLVRREIFSERERQGAMLQQMPGFVVVMSGPDHRIDYFNDAFVEVTGQRDYLGHTVREMFPELEGQGFQAILDRVYATGEPFFANEVPVRLGDDDRFFNFVYQPVRDDAGLVTGIFAGGYEVTEAVRAVKALRESEERLRLVVDAAAGAFYSVDREGHTTLVSREFVEMMGFGDKSEALGRKLHDVIHHTHPDGSNYPVQECPIYRCASTGEAAHISYELFFRLDGSSIPVEYWVSSIIRDGEHIGAICTILDLTERKKAEEALHQSAAEFEALAENVSQLAWMAEPDGSIFWYNKRWYDYTGTTAEDQKGWGWESVHDPEILPAVTERWRNSLATGTPFEMTFPLKGADGEFRPFLTRVVPIRDESGAIVRWFGTNTDVTELRHAQDALRALAETLEERVEERTFELMQAQEALRQSQKLEAMGQLTGGVAHDFNNLLTPIVGSLDMLQRRQLGDERERRLIDGAVQSAERARTLVQRLLAFARRQPLTPSAIDPGKLIEGMAGLVSSTSGPQIKVLVRTPDDLQAAFADPNQLEMAILNLAVNARDAMPEGGTLTLSVDNDSIGPNHRSSLPPGDYVRLSVSDTGTGMSDATMARAIEPFFSTKGIGKGTGLGLSMVHGLASQLGGAMMLSSQPGMGTKVELWLPVSKVAAEASAPDTGQESSCGTGAVVLLVDDEAAVRASTADMLEELGYAVVEADSAAAALKLLDDGLVPDLLLTDHLMPGMTGADLAREVRGRWPDRPILLITGFAEVEDVAPDLPRLTKPFRQAELSAMLVELTA